MKRGAFWIGSVDGSMPILLATAAPTALGPVDKRQLPATGRHWLWLALRFLFVHDVAGHSWRRLFAYYDMLGGRL